MSLYAPNRSVNVLWSSLVISCPNVSIINNSCDYRFDSGNTLAKSIDSLAILSLRNDPFRIVWSLPTLLSVSTANSLH